MFNDESDTQSDIDNEAAEAAAYAEAEAILEGRVPASDETKEKVCRWMLDLK